MQSIIEHAMITEMDAITAVKIIKRHEVYRIYYTDKIETVMLYGSYINEIYSARIDTSFDAKIGSVFFVPVKYQAIFDLLM